MEKLFWMEKNWGESLDSIDTVSAFTAIEEVKKSDDHKAALWIGCNDQQYVLKIQKNKELVLIHGENQDIEIRNQASKWQEVRSFAGLFLSGDFQKLLQRMHPLRLIK